MTRLMLALLSCACLVCSPALAGNYTNTINWQIQSDTTTGGNSTGSSTLFNGGDSTKGDGSVTFTGAVLTIGDATHNATFTLKDGNVYLKNYAGNTLTINAGSTLSLKTNKLPDTTGLGTSWPTPSDVNILNWDGDINWAGKIQFQPRNLTWGNGPGNVGVTRSYTMVDNYGLMNIVGQDATIERLPNPDGNTVYGFEVGPFMNWGDTGRLTGNGKLTYLNSTGDASKNTMEMGNYGTIAPGTPDAPGTLELVNMNLWAGYSGKMEFRLGGTADGTYDVLTLSGTGGVLESGMPTKITPTNGFVPQSGDQWRIMNYDSTYYGQSGAQATFNLGGGYQIEFYSDHAMLSYVPEPATLTMLVLAGAALLRRRR